MQTAVAALAAAPAAAAAAAAAAAPHAAPAARFCSVMLVGIVDATFPFHSISNSMSMIASVQDGLPTTFNRGS